MSDLRKSFWKLILERARLDKKVMVLVGDLGFSFFEKFRDELPKQFINAGIAEQNAIGISTGLALAGFKPYVYSNSLFLLSRANEFVRDEICYNKLDVKLIGTGAAGFLGFSHNMVKNEDKNLIKSFPNIKGYWPRNEKELKKVLFLKGASYIRI